MNPFPFEGLLGGIFYFYSNFNRTFCQQSVDPDQTPHSAVSDLGLHCLPMSHKKDARLIILVKAAALTQVKENCIDSMKRRTN